MMAFSKLAVALSGALLTTTTCAVLPEEKPLTMIVPFAAGGPADRVARELMLAMSEHLGRPMVIKNVGGAGGTIGARKVANAPKDGSTVLIHHVGMSTAPTLYKNLGFDPLTAFEYIGRIADVPMVLVATKGLSPASHQELGPYLQANADKVSIANAGTGSASHLCGLMFMAAIQQDLITVSYRGTAPALADLIGGHVQLLCDQSINVAGHLSANHVKGYGAMTLQRIPVLRDIPTFGEQGLRSFDLNIWYGMYAPKGTPKPVVDRLAAALQVAVQDTTFKARMNALGAEVVSPSKATPEGLRQHLKDEINKWFPLITNAGRYAG